jgi:hypothetical protein
VTHIARPITPASLISYRRVGGALFADVRRPRHGHLVSLNACGLLKRKEAKAPQCALAWRLFRPSGSIARHSPAVARRTSDGGADIACGPTVQMPAGMFAAHEAF